MSNVVEFKLPKEPEALNSFFDILKEDTDELVFIQVAKDGSVACGHSDLSLSNLALMCYQLQNFIQHLLDKGLTE